MLQLKHERILNTMFEIPREILDSKIIHVEVWKKDESPCVLVLDSTFIVSSKATE